MVLTTVSSQKVPGTPARAQFASEHSPRSNALAGFSFVHIGQDTEPALLKRLGNTVNTDQEEELQYPSSRSSPLVPDAPASSAVSRETALDAIRGRFSTNTTNTSRKATPVPETSVALAALPSTSILNPPTSFAGSSPHSTPSIRTTNANFKASQSEHTDTMNPPFAQFPVPGSREADTRNMSSLPSSSTSPSASAGTSARPRCQEASPPDLVARISQVALEKAEWNEMKHLMERYRREHDELLRRNDESARAHQKEREQALKVSAIADAAFSKLENLLLWHERRLAHDQQQAELALTEAQSIISDRKARQTSEAEAKARAAVEVEERHKATAGGARRAAEETKRASVVEESRIEVGRDQAERERQEAEKWKVAELRKPAEEQRRAQAAEEARKAQAAEEERKAAAAEEERKAAAEEERKAAAAEEERRRTYAAQRAAADLEKRAYIEAQRLEARQNQEKRPKPAKEELKARLEKEKEAASRSTSVSSAGYLAPAKIDFDREPSTHDSRSVPRANAPPLGGPVPSTLPVRHSNPPKPAFTQAPRMEEAQPGKINGKRDSHVGAQGSDGHAQLIAAIPSTVAPTQQTAKSDETQSRNQICSDAHDSINGTQPTNTAPCSPLAIPAQAAPGGGTSRRAAAQMDQRPSAPQYSVPSSPATTIAPSVAKASSNGTTAQTTMANQAEHVDVKRESPVDLIARAQVHVPSVLKGTDSAIHNHIRSPATNGPSVCTSSYPLASTPPSVSAVKGSERPLSTGFMHQEKIDPTPTPSSLHRRSPVPANKQTDCATSDANGDVDPWVNTPRIREEYSHRRVDFREERSHSQSASYSYSPPRPVTPPAREYDHYSPPIRRDEWSPTNRKRSRPTADTGRPDDDDGDGPPPRRARVLHTDDSQPQRRFTAPGYRGQPAQGYCTKRDGPSYDNGSADEPRLRQTSFSQSYSTPQWADGPSQSQPSNGSIYDEGDARLAPRTTVPAPASSPLLQPLSWPAEHSAQSDHRSLISRLSDKPISSNDVAARGRRATSSMGRARGRGNRQR